MLTPRQYQLEAEVAIWNYFNAGNTGNPIVALPTGTGKSLVIAWFTQHVMEKYPKSRIMILTHVKELIKQNSDKLEEVWPMAPYGIYSAGLKKRECKLPIVYGGIATVKNDLNKFDKVDLLLVDEAHLMSGQDDSMYGEVVSHLRALNPFLKVIGFTATPYRTGQGLLTESGLFTDVAIDLTSMAQFNRLIDEGYLCMLVPKRTDMQFDLSKIRTRNGDYCVSDLEERIDHRDANYLACRESIQYGAERKSWLAFASGIKHAEHIAEMMRNFGIPAVSVHSKMDAAERDTRIKDFRNGKIRCIVSNNVLTTGFDHPPIDLILMLRPTLSTGLWVQMLGRGTRPSVETGKKDCLCLDFAGNTPRLGPINDPVMPHKRGSTTPGVAPIRICDQCGTYNHASATSCYVCGYEFPHQVKINPTAGTDELIRTDIPLVHEFRVDRALYNKITSNGYNIFKVNYVCGLRSFSEIVCLEHPGRARGMAAHWWKLRMGSELAPPSVDEALIWASRLAVPKTISVDVNQKYPKVVKAEF